MAELTHRRGQLCLLRLVASTFPIPCLVQYDLDYPYLSDATKYEEPLFLHYLDARPKRYIYDDAFEVLSEHIKTIPDVHYCSDTHWGLDGVEQEAYEIDSLISTRTDGELSRRRAAEAVQSQEQLKIERPE